MRKNGRQMMEAGDEPAGLRISRAKQGPAMEKLLNCNPAELEIRLRRISDIDYLRELNWRAASRRKPSASAVIVERIKSLM